MDGVRVRGRGVRVSTIQNVSAVGTQRAFSITGVAPSFVIYTIGMSLQFGGVWGLEFDVLATSKVMSVRVPTCDNAHSW